MAIIGVSDVCLNFGDGLLFDHIHLQLEKKERVCLLGRNGCGKTTLMKLLSGEIEPDTGVVTRSHGAVVARLDQNVPSHISGSIIDCVTAGLGEKGKLLADYYRASTRLTETGGRDHKYLKQLDRLNHALNACGGWESHRKVEMIISRMNLNPELKFQALSAGLKRRVLLTRTLVSEPDVLMLDEPTNHLDIPTIAWLEKFLMDYDGTLVLVTHDRMLVQRVANRIIEIDRGKLLDWRCDYPSFLKRKEEVLHAENKLHEREDKHLQQEEIWIRQGIKARRTRNEGRVMALLKMREQRRNRRERLGKVNITLQEAHRPGQLVIEAKDVNFGYNETSIVKNLTSTIMRGDRVGIIGPNGCGKTTLLQVLLQELTPTKGAIRLGTKLEITYFEQLRNLLDEGKTVVDSIADGNDRFTINGKMMHVIGYLQHFLFTPDRARAKVKVLSGGERCRLLLARLFTNPTNVLVMDEPTNDLDVETLELLEEVLLEYQGTLLMVSHDRAFLNNVVTSTLVFEEDGDIQEYIGGYDDWVSQKPEPPPPEPEKPQKKSMPKPRKQSKKLSYNEEWELKTLPQQIEDLETEKEKIYQTLSNPKFYQQPGDQISKIQDRLKSIEDQLEHAYSRWEFLEEK